MTEGVLPARTGGRARCCQRDTPGETAALQGPGAAPRGAEVVTGARVARASAGGVTRSQGRHRRRGGAGRLPRGRSGGRGAEGAGGAALWPRPSPASALGSSGRAELGEPRPGAAAEQRRGRAQ